MEFIEEIARKDYDLAAWETVTNNFVDNKKSTWFNVLDRDVVDWYTTRLTFGGDIAEQMIMIALNDPYPDKYLNVGIIDCVFAAGQLDNLSSLSSLFPTGHPIKDLFPTTEYGRGHKGRWSLRESWSAFVSGNSTNGVNTHCYSYPRTPAGIKGHLNSIIGLRSHSGWATPRVSAASAASIPDSLFFVPFTEVRTLSILLEELNLINSLVTIPFNGIIRGLMADTTINPDKVSVIPAMIRAGAKNVHIDCMAFPWITFPLLQGTALAGSGTTYTKGKYLSRENIVLKEIINKVPEHEDRLAVFSAVVLEDAPDTFRRSAFSALEHGLSDPSKHVWRLGKGVYTRNGAKCFGKPMFLEGYVEYTDVEDIRSTIKAGNPDTTTYESTESPARPTLVKLKGFADVSKPAERKPSDPMPLGSLRAGAPSMEDRMGSLEDKMDKLIKILEGK